jgi:hypothetical protein
LRWLIDLADREQFPPADLLILETYSQEIPGPGPGEQYGQDCIAVAHIDLATALLRAGRLDAAAAALGPVLSIPPGKRINRFPRRLTRVRAELARNPYQGSPWATELDEHIEEFTCEAIVRDLHDLPAGSD